MIKSIPSGTLIKTILYTSEIDEETIKEHVKQVNTQVDMHNALPLDDKSTAKKIADSIKCRFPDID